MKTEFASFPRLPLTYNAVCLHGVNGGGTDDCEQLTSLWRTALVRQLDNHPDPGRVAGHRPARPPSPSLSVTGLIVRVHLCGTWLYSFLYQTVAEAKAISPFDCGSGCLFGLCMPFHPLRVLHVRVVSGREDGPPCLNNRSRSFLSGNHFARRGTGPGYSCFGVPDAASAFCPVFQRVRGQQHPPEAPPLPGPAAGGHFGGVRAHAVPVALRLGAFWLRCCAPNPNLLPVGWQGVKSLVFGWWGGAPVSRGGVGRNVRATRVRCPPPPQIYAVGQSPGPQRP